MNTQSNLPVSYILYLADNNLILAQRNSEWCGHGPILEQDIAITNITLDLIGQARMLYQLAADILNQQNGNQEATEDTLAYLRDERAFSNVLMVELPKGNWGFTVLRQYLFSEFQYLLYKHLSADATLSAIAIKSLKEVTYHVQWSREWVLRLGDGTSESHQKMMDAVQDIWMYTGELFDAAPFEDAPVLQQIQTVWQQRIAETFEEATLTIPENVFIQKGGKNGIHTEHLGYMLAEMQYLQRMYPNATW
ncbi:MAG: phenylacetate-CoA oxygenase subunit PaaC [Ferruginibacter sp.]|nr:phenylacetate-CoA oxygenase subunit PaaC [Ferruginibacter sp.]